MSSGVWAYLIIYNYRILFVIIFVVSIFYNFYPQFLMLINNRWRECFKATRKISCMSHTEQLYTYRCTVLTASLKVTDMHLIKS
jgi:hypothetical protein